MGKGLVRVVRGKWAQSVGDTRHNTNCRLSIKYALDKDIFKGDY